VQGEGESAGWEKIAATCALEHFSDEQYVCGSHQDCHDVDRTETESYTCMRSESYVCGETCTDNGNGFETCNDQMCDREVPDTCTRQITVFDHQECRTVDDYCSRPIMKEKCDYKTQKWVAVRTPSLTGTGTKDLKWPEVELEPLQRGVRSGSYQMVVAYTDQGKEQSLPEDLPLSEYLSWQEGQEVFLQINNLGGVTSYSPQAKE
jgi:hypothetical protein